MFGDLLHLNVGARRLLFVELVCFEDLQQLDIGVALFSPAALLAKQLDQGVFLLDNVVLDECLRAID